jgi:hypothetical protein
MPGCAMTGSTIPPTCTTTSNCTAIPGSSCLMFSGLGFCYKSCTM